MPPYITTMLGLARLDWEVKPGVELPLVHSYADWGGGVPADPKVVIGETTFEGVVNGTTVSYDLGDTTGLVDKDAVLYHGDTAKAAGTVVRWTGPAGSSPGTISIRLDDTTGSILPVPEEGIPGAAGEIVSATAVALPPGSTPTVTLGGTPSARTVELGLVTGATGAEGPPQPAYLVAAARAGLGPLMTPYVATDPLRGPVVYGTADAYTAGTGTGAGKYPNLAVTGPALDVQEPATATQRPTRTQADGKWGINFDGSDDLLLIPDDPRLDVTATGQLSVVLVLEAASGASGRVLIAKKATPTTGAGWMLRCSTTAPNQVLWTVSDGTPVSQVTGKASDFASATDVIVATIGSTSITVGSTIARGDEPASLARPTGDCSNAVSLVIGRQSSSGTTTQFPMRLLAWAIYDRAISGAEALRITDAALGRTQPSVSETIAKEAGPAPVLVQPLGAALPSPVTISALPSALNQRAMALSGIQTQDSITTHAGVQYAVYVDSTSKPRVTWRTLPAGAWATPIDLSLVTGNPLAAYSLDLHNTYVVGVSSDGRVHVSGNHHANLLRYIMSAANDPTTWAAGTMIGTQETLVTYPTFVTLPSGDLLFFYRDGGSGAGDLICNKYAGSGTWTRQATVIAGTGESAYWHRIAVDPTTGAIHVAYELRGTTAGNTTHDVCHIQSLDGGVTWKSMAGTTLTLPVTPATSPIVVATNPTNSGLINNGGCAVVAGKPHIVYRRNDTAGRTNIFHAWWTGTAWIDRQVTRFDHTITVGGIPGGEGFPRPQLVASPAGRLILLYTTAHPSKRDRVWAVDLTDPDRMREWAIVENFDTVEHEIGIDSVAVEQTGVLHFLLAASVWDTTSTRYGSIYPWAAQRGLVCSVDLADAASWPDRRPLRMEVLDSAVVADATTASATLADVAGAVLTVGATLAGQELWARMTVVGRVSAGGTTMTVSLREGGATSILDQRVFSTTTDTVQRGPWVPLVEVPVTPGTVRPMTSLTGAGTGRLSVTVEIGTFRR